jgi:RNA polymerase sigma-70 factor, ECF subfamily
MDPAGSPHCAAEVAIPKTAEATATRRDEAALPPFDAIYAEHADFLYAVLRRLGLDAPSAEDALQDVFVVVHRKRASFEGRGTLRSWLYSIAVRVAREHRRRRGLRRRFFDLFGARSEVERHADEGRPDPEAALEAAEQLRRLDGILRGLSAERREVFVLVEVAGCTAPEAAEALEVNLNTVYSRLRLARADVRAALARERAKDERRLR